MKIQQTDTPGGYPREEVARPFPPSSVPPVATPRAYDQSSATEIPPINSCNRTLSRYAGISCNTDISLHGHRGGEADHGAQARRVRTGYRVLEVHDAAVGRRGRADDGEA